ncbi:MAG: endonuclease III [Xanthomonadales bacterium]|nr:endonuclease III [Xanthomonadales bacterium]
MKPPDRQEFFRRLQSIDPKPVTELAYDSPFSLLIAVLLSAQATDISVNKATRGLFKAANTPQQMLQLGEAGVKNFIRTIGLFNTKAANIIKTCRILQDDYEGQVPANRAALEQLPGVGRKTANVVLNTAFGQPTIAVDTHIFRVSNRTSLAPGKTPLQVELKLLKVVPQEFRQHAHHWLILHGRYTCKARKPACPECIVRDLCAFKAKTE